MAPLWNILMKLSKSIQIYSEKATLMLLSPSTILARFFQMWATMSLLWNILVKLLKSRQLY